jgi:hypothetical protein
MLLQEKEILKINWADIEIRELQLQVDAMKLSRRYAEKKATEWKELLELLRRTEATVVGEQRQYNTGDSQVGPATAGSVETPSEEKRNGNGKPVDKESLRQRSKAMAKAWREHFQGR